VNRVEIKRLGMIGLLLRSEPRQTEYVALIKSSNSRFPKYCHAHPRAGAQIRCYWVRRGKCAAGSELFWIPLLL